MLVFIDNVVTNPNPAEYMSVLELMTKGGIVMIPILLFSMISVYVFIDKLIYVIKNAKLLDRPIGHHHHIGSMVP